eukprot:53856-Eustigmatos_ZCMA.PRE.1
MPHTMPLFYDEHAAGGGAMYQVQFHGEANSSAASYWYGTMASPLPARFQTNVYPSHATFRTGLP